jgi:hypothetical protein
MIPPCFHSQITKDGVSKSVADGFYIITEPLAKGWAATTPVTLTVE